MRVDWLSLTNFRSYPDLDWRPEAGVNLLFGPNGAGKTNLLEAVAYLATLRSFRSVPDASLIRDDTETAIIRAGISFDGRERAIEIEMPRKGSRRTQVDKSRLQRTADLLGVLRVIAFLPEDLDLVKRGPAYRRDLLDSVAVQLWPGAYLDQSEFDRSLRQRNAFLKSGQHDEPTLSVWDSRLAQSGGRVMARRSRVIETLADLLDEAYREISQRDHGASIGYSATWDDQPIANRSASDYAASIQKALEGVRRADFDRRVTTVGPHRDEPLFIIDERDARSHGSQGEQRTMALAVKLAAHRAVAEVVGQPPVLVLDDVFSELDPSRSAALAKALPADTQTLISSARPEDVPLVGTTWRVDKGVTLV
ncbi:MAG: DNA replication/repair protein RecF [Acidimicrobiia bacterium]